MSFENRQPLKKIFPGLDFRQIFSQEPEEQLELINLTRLFQRTLQKYLSQAGRNSVITRLDKLPLVAGGKEQLEQLTDTLINLIVNDLPRSAGKLFLHIKCEKINGDIMDLSLKNGYSSYSISFYTSVLPNDNWRVSCKGKLKECADIASRYKGTFSFQQAFGSCCLFSLTFPGKLE